MPSGKTHDRITLWTLPWVAAACYGITRSGFLTLLVAGSYLFSGLMFGPDLDIYSIQYKRWGIFRFIWQPYQKLLSHRSFLSHGLIVGTSLRVIYLSFILLVFAVLGLGIAHALGLGQPSIQQELMKMKVLSQSGIIEAQPVAIAIFVGLELGAMSHALSDRIGSAYRRWQSPKKKVKNRAKSKKALSFVKKRR